MVIRLIPGRQRGIELAEEADERNSSINTLPLLGRIAASQPIETIPYQGLLNLTKL